MSIRNILLAHSGTSGFPSSLGHAIRVAKKHNAWLTCIYSGSTSFFDQVLVLSDELREKLGAVRTAKIDDLRQQFDQEAAAAGIGEKAQFLLPATVGKLTISDVARNFDFVVTGYHAKLPNDEYRAASPDLIALQSGRPVLVVPDGYQAEELGGHALVAWDGKRSAARAINDAMTVLEQKPRKVTLVSVGDHFPEAPEGAGIMDHLARHGVEADYIKRPRSGSGIAQVISSTADEIGAKLIVMGAYEHSKFSQDLFGGVTHDVVRSARVPVFMSH
nr:universal stress protein family domain protein UspA [uncultured bacterium]